MKMYEMVREEVKMANLTLVTVLIDSDAMSIRLVHKVAGSMPRSAHFVAILEVNKPIAYIMKQRRLI